MNRLLPPLFYLAVLFFFLSYTEAAYFAYTSAANEFFNTPSCHCPKKKKTGNPIPQYKPQQKWNLRISSNPEAVSKSVNCQSIRKKKKSFVFANLSSDINFFIFTMQKFKWQNLAPHKEPENILLQQFNHDLKRPSEEKDRDINVIQLANDDQYPTNFMRLLTDHMRELSTWGIHIEKKKIPFIYPFFFSHIFLQPKNRKWSSSRVLNKTLNLSSKNSVPTPAPLQFSPVWSSATKNPINSVIAKRQLLCSPINVETYSSAPKTACLVNKKLHFIFFIEDLFFQIFPQLTFCTKKSTRSSGTNHRHTPKYSSENVSSLKQKLSSGYTAMRTWKTRSSWVSPKCIMM